MIIHPQGRQEGVPPSKTDALLIELLLKNIFAENVKKIVFASHTKNGFLQPSHSNNQDGNSVINHVANICLCVDTRVDNNNF
jgi:hypothetical protein